MHTLIHFRNKYGFTQLDMAAYLGVSLSTIKMAETCKRILPTNALLVLKNLKEVARSLEESSRHIPEQKLADEDLKKMSYAEFVLQQKQKKMKMRMAFEDLLETDFKIRKSLEEKGTEIPGLGDMSPEEIKIRRHQLQKQKKDLQIEGRKI